MTEPMHVATDVLVIGAGGAGMYAAIEAARAGATVMLADRSLIGRGGATVMAQMTVAWSRLGRRPRTIGPIIYATRCLLCGWPQRPLRDRAPRATVVRGGTRLHPGDGRMGRSWLELRHDGPHRRRHGARP